MSKLFNDATIANDATPAADIRYAIFNPTTGKIYYITQAQLEALISGGVAGPISSTDNAIVRWDGTGGDTVQNSGVTIDDSDNITSGANLSQTGTTQKVQGTSTDGSDDDAKYITPFSLISGTPTDGTRGGWMAMFGNEHSSFGGHLWLVAGEGASDPIRFYTGGALRATLTSSGLSIVDDLVVDNAAAGSGSVFGNATGGAQGAGTINAVGVYDDGSILTDYVFELENDGEAIDKVPEWYTNKTLQEETEHVKKEKHLSNMPSRKEWGEKKFSTGELINRLMATIEKQHIYITQLEQRISKLENG